MKALYLAENTGAYPNPDMTPTQLMHHSGHNVGNFAFWNAARLVVDADIEFLPFGGKRRNPEAPVDLILIPAANFLNETAELGWLADTIETIDRPVLIFGLGAQSEHDNKMPKLTEGTVRFLHAVSKRTPYLALRGPFSEQVCRENGVENVRVLGCPSLFTNADRTLGPRIEAEWGRPVEKVAVHAASIKAHVRPAERFLFNLLQTVPGSSYIVQRPVELMKVFRGLSLGEKEAAYVERLRLFLAPDLSPERFRQVLRMSGMIPFSIDSWRFALQTHSHSLGTRIHGAMMSLAAALPTICITHDTRTRELCSVMQVPAVRADSIRPGSSVSEIFADTKFDGEAFESNRSALAAQYADLLSAAGFQPSRYMKKNFL